MRVVSLCWSPFEVGKLLSVSYDGTAQIWDVPNSCGLANFREHVSRVFCGIWSPFDKNCIITGGEEGVLMVWDYTKQLEKMPIRKTTKPKYTKEKRAFLATETETPTSESTEQELLDIIESKKQEILTNQAMDQNGIGKEKVFKLNKKNYFGLSILKEHQNREKAHTDLDFLSKHLSSDLPITNEDIVEYPHLAVFSGQENFLNEVIGKEMSGVPNSEHAFMLRQWSCQDLEKSIESQFGNLKDWHVSLAASVSFSLWKTTCRAYAKQLEDANDSVKASSYYLLVHDIDKAIQVLVQSNFFHAALTIAKSRLPKDSPMIIDLFKQWACRATQDGLYELASKCWFAAGFPVNAALALAKKPDGHCLRVASEIMNQAGELEQARVLAFQALELFKKNEDHAGLTEFKDSTKIDEVKQQIIETLQNSFENMNLNHDSSKEVVTE